MDDLTQFMPLAQTLGIRIDSASADEVVGTLEIRREICTTGHIAHGGSLMAFADTLGAVAAFLSLPEGAKATTTVESKTNFLGPAAEGSTITGTTTPVKVGRRLSVWQTRIVGDDGRDVALVTQTQLVL